VRLDTIEHPLVLDLLRRFHAAEVAPMLYDFTVDTGVPVYLANIYDRQSRQIGLSSGFGAHLDPEIAMLRALTEVAQSRLIHISGSRDDIFRHEDLRHRVADSADFIANLERIPPSIDARERRSEATGSFEGDIAVLIRHLRQVGVRQVIVLDLTHEEHAIPVVRVIVPTLEGYAFHLYEPGRRAKAFCEACAGRQ
jgi:ribosomal protein S12 methylthiotransferase accessory factor